MQALDRAGDQLCKVSRASLLMLRAVTEEIERLGASRSPTKRISREPPRSTGAALPAAAPGRKLIVLDLDNTLIATTSKPILGYASVDQLHRISAGGMSSSVSLRPGAVELIKWIPGFRNTLTVVYF